MRKHSEGNNPSRERLKIAGASFLAVRSPDAPKITRIVDGLFASFSKRLEVGLLLVILNPTYMQVSKGNGNVFVVKNLRFRTGFDGQVDFH
jgi:hypothetical protein